MRQTQSHVIQVQGVLDGMHLLNQHFLHCCHTHADFVCSLIPVESAKRDLEFRLNLDRFHTDAMVMQY